MQGRLLLYAISLLLELREATPRSTPQPANNSFLPFVSRISHDSEAPCHQEPTCFCILRLKLPPSKILGISCCLSIKPPSERWCSCISFWAACCCVCPQKMSGLKLGGVLAVWLEGPPIAAFTSLKSFSWTSVFLYESCWSSLLHYLFHWLIRPHFFNSCILLDASGRCLKQTNKTPMLWLLEYFERFSELRYAIANKFNVKV